MTADQGSLGALQREFGLWLRAGDAGLLPRLGLADQRGLPVYQNNYRAQLIGCLEESFPHTLAWLGETAFHAAAAAYIDHTPPTAWTLDAYPAGFPALLDRHYPADPEVGDLAALEWRLSECFVAADAPALAPADLATTDWDIACLHLVPSASFLPVRSNAPAIWSALAAGETPPDVAVFEHPATLLVWRQEFTCCFRPLDPVEQDVLRDLAQGLPFTTLCEHLVAALGEPAGIAAAGNLLARWTAEALLRAISAV
ncbi:MAG: hypothetical protein RLZZ84_1544 [Pseudomonadota bacterium]|jgi:hypothetical protein